MVVQQTHPEREDSNRVKVIVSPVGRQGRPGTPGVSIRFFDTLQEALDLQPRPENGVTFQVREETDPEHFGFYVFDSAEPDGYRRLGDRWDDEYLNEIENRIDAFEQDVEGQVQGLETRVEEVETDMSGFKAEVNQRVEDAEDAVQSLQDTTARYAFDTLQEAQDKWASFSQEEKDELEGREVAIGDYIHKWTSSGVSEPIRSLNPVKTSINKGLPYPFVNQPEVLTESLRKFNDTILDVTVEETKHDDDLYYSITLIARNAGSINNWGNAVAVRAINKSDGTQKTSFAWRSTDENLDAEHIRQLNKISEGGFQTLTLVSEGLSKTFHITIDSDAIQDGDILDASYSDQNSPMRLDGSVYRLEPDLSSFATQDELQGVEDGLQGVEDEIQSLDSFMVNKGKAYPWTGFDNSAAEGVVERFQNVFLDGSIKLTEQAAENYIFSISGVYQNNAQVGYGLILKRKPKVSGATGYTIIGTLRDNQPSLDNMGELLRMERGGIQTLKILIEGWGCELTITIDMDALPDDRSFFDINYSETIRDTLPNLRMMDAVTSVIKDEEPEPDRGITKFNTFREAIEEEYTGTMQVGSTLARSVVSNVQFPGANASYRPDAVSNQYSIIGDSSTPQLPLKHKLIRILTPLNDYALVRSICENSGYIYFGRGNTEFFRTKDELIHNPTTFENTSYERIIVPANVEGGVNPNNIRNVYEMDNGELLIELQNGEREEGGNYQTDITNLYVTNGFTSMEPVAGDNGIPTYDLQTEDLTLVADYVRNTSTRQGWSISMHKNNIAIAPYGQGRCGKVLYSDDYGRSFKTIFNMDVPDVFVDTRPDGGSVGAWPTPESLNPPMPSNMWDLGGGSNRHTHGVIYDPYFDRIWVATGDAGVEEDGVTAIWYTDDKGLSWTRISTLGSWKYDAYNGFQGIKGVATADYVLFGSDSATNGYVRYNRGNKDELPELEPAYYATDGVYDNNALTLIEGGTIETKDGIFGLFHGNYPAMPYTVKGRVCFSRNGLDFEDIFIDPYTTDSGSEVYIDWGTWLAQDKYGNILIKLNVLQGTTVESGGVIKLYK